MEEQITDVVKATILRSFTAREVELGDSRETSWRWAEGVVLFPEAHCPFCSATMQSNRIWKVGNEGCSLEGQYRLELPVEQQMGRLIKEPPEHPHVTGTSICRGTTASAQAALFFSINPRDCYWGSNNEFGRTRIKAWMLKMFDHRCGVEGKAVGVQCPTCSAFFVVSDPPHDCMLTPCGCGCGCFPADYNNACYHYTCRCCRSCRCGARITAFRTAQGLETPVTTAITCPHECCITCCRAREDCITPYEVWCEGCEQRIDSDSDNCECSDDDDSDL